MYYASKLQRIHERVKPSICRELNEIFLSWMNIYSLKPIFTGKGSLVLWISAFLVETNYLSQREIEVNAGIAEIRQRKLIRKMNDVRSYFCPIVEIIA
jgi:hypothetical protein